MPDPLPRRRRRFPDLAPTELGFLADVLRRETVGGLLALGAAVLAVVWANSPWATAYHDLQHLQLGPLDIEHWAADGALAIFFFVAGLELKRELVVGSLSRPVDALVPVVAACCGVAVPALIYTMANLGSRGHLAGWAVPAATDIAFALAVLAVVGSNLPASLRAFLLTLAVVDDLIVIVIIAVFFSASIELVPLVLAGLAFAAYAVGQALRWPAWPFLFLGVLAWWCLHESGIHATIAGVVLGLLTRVRRDPTETSSPAERLEHRWQPISAGLVVPFFALMSAGVAFSGGRELLHSPVAVGVVAGLVLGKPLGVLGGSFLVTRLTHAELDEEIGWRDLFGVAILAGIGFTVSLLVAELAFADAGTQADQLTDVAKAGVLLGSVVSAVLGALVLGHRDRFRATP